MGEKADEKPKQKRGRGVIETRSKTIARLTKTCPREITRHSENRELKKISPFK